MSAILSDAVDAERLQTNTLAGMARFASQERCGDILAEAEMMLLFPAGNGGPDACLERALHGDHVPVGGHDGHACRGGPGIQLRQVLWRYRAVLVDRTVRGICREAESGPPKNGEARVVLAPERTIRELERWRASTANHAAEDLVFPGEATLGVRTNAWMDRRWHAALEATEIRREVRYLVLHCLRHRYNTRVRASPRGDTACAYRARLRGDVRPLDHP